MTENEPTKERAKRASSTQRSASRDKPKRASRMPASRWIRIGTWTAASLAWSTALITGIVSGEPANLVPTTDPAPSSDSLSTMAVAVSAMPDMPKDGLVVVRFDPVAPPSPPVIQRTVVVDRYVKVTGPAVPAPSPAPASTSAASPTPAPQAAPAETTQAAPPPPPPPPPAPAPVQAPAPVIESAGS